MSVIKLSPVVAAIADVVALFDRIMVYRSTDGAGGPFLPITTPATAIPLVAGQITYAYEDLNGLESYYYCVQYISTETGAVSGFSTPQLGSGSAAESIVSIATLKTNYLFGVDLSDPSGNAIPDSFYSFFLASAVGITERLLDIPLTVKTVTGEQHEHTRLQQNDHTWIKLDNHVVQSIQNVSMRYPGQGHATPVPLEWCVLDKDRGILQIVPGNYGGNQGFLGGGVAYGGGYGGAYGANYYGHLGARKSIPAFYSVDYTAGFAPGQCPAEIADVVGMQAALPVLDVAGDLLGGAGIASQSLSIDGLSQSINTTSSPMYSGYGARVNLYNEALKTKIPIIRKFYAGEALAVV